MPIYDCTFPGCLFSTGDHEMAVALQFLTIHGHSHAQGNSNVGFNVTNIDRIQKPKISMGCTIEKWDYFLTKWSTFKEMTKIPIQSVSALLLDCCNEELAIELNSTHGDMKHKPEAEVMEAIKEMAVITEKRIVARVILLDTTQDREEPVRNFMAKLKGRARACKYVKKHNCSQCNHEDKVNYSDDMVRDVLIRGLNDADIRLDILCDPNEDMSLEQTVVLIEAKEKGKRSELKLSNSQQVNAMRSTYKRVSLAPLAGNHNKDALCNWCGGKGHGSNRNMRQAERKGICPAYGKKCTHCEKPHHFATVCRKKKHQQLTGQPNASAVESYYTGVMIDTPEAGTGHYIGCNASSQE